MTSNENIETTSVVKAILISNQDYKHYMYCIHNIQMSLCSHGLWKLNMINKQNKVIIFYAEHKYCQVKQSKLNCYKFILLTFKNVKYISQHYKK